MLWLDKNKVQYNAQRCTQCGTCLAACPVSAISRTFDARAGMFTLAIDQNKCIRCTRCVRICPAHSIAEHAFSPDELDGKSCFLTCSNDGQTQYKASSGGLATELIKASVQNGRSAYCLLSHNQFPGARGGYLDTIKECSAIASSRYLPVCVNENLSMRSGELLVIGTPCQLLGARNFYKSSQMKLFTVALLCKQQKLYHYTRFLRRHLNLAEDQPVQYRGSGWPGITGTDQSSVRFDWVAGLAFGKALWRIPGCRYCTHCMGSYADITLADPWGIDRKHGIGNGMTLAIVHTEQGLQMLQECDQRITKQNISTQDAITSMNWPAYVRKIEAAEHYSGKTKMRYLVADWQRKLYETILSKFRLSDFALRILARIPFGG